MGDLTDAFMKLARARMCPNTPMQYAIPAALEGDQSHLDAMMKKVKARADLVLNRLEKLDGFSCVRPRGAFYVFPSITTPGSSTDQEFIVDFLKETGVVTVPGSGFGQKPGTKHMRIVLLPIEEQLTRAMDLLEEFVLNRS